MHQGAIKQYLRWFFRGGFLFTVTMSTVPGLVPHVLNGFCLVLADIVAHLILVLPHFLKLIAGHVPKFLIGVETVPITITVLILVFVLVRIMDLVLVA